MRLVSYYHTKEAAHKAAVKLRKLEAKNVRVGAKNKSGYPVYSTAPATIDFPGTRKALSGEDYRFTSLIVNHRRYGT